jgi:secreted PhoX family phosphatase
MSTVFSRRDFLHTGLLVTAGLLTFRKAFASPVTDWFEPANPATGYGPLLPDPQGLLNLPQGFTYTIVQRQGTRMDDGLLMPGHPDGMATFPGPDNTVVVVRNHEVNVGENSAGAFGERLELLTRHDSAWFYDRVRAEYPGLGGTSTFVFDERSNRLVSSYLSLAGTVRNCAGGRTPWGSWLTCEEDVATPRTSKMGKDHGYVFEVPATASLKPAVPVALTAMGRFNHEAVCIDPRTGIVYLTEDRNDGLIYRFIPNEPGKLAKGGQLQALVVKGQAQTDTRNWHRQTLTLNQQLAVEWIPLQWVESPDDDLRYQGFDRGAARFARGEGMWFGEREAYWTCTNGGPAKMGQVFKYTPSPFEGTPREAEAPGSLEPVSYTHLRAHET